MTVTRPTSDARASQKNGTPGYTRKSLGQALNRVLMKEGGAQSLFARHRSIYLFQIALEWRVARAIRSRSARWLWSDRQRCECDARLRNDAVWSGTVGS